MEVLWQVTNGFLDREMWAKGDLLKINCNYALISGY